MKPKQKSVVQTLFEASAFVGVTKGHIVIERFCNAVDNGETPTEDDLKLLSKALKHLRDNQKTGNENESRDALACFSKTLGLTKKQGRQEITGLDALRLADISVTFLREQERLIEEGNTPSYARQKARQIAIEREAAATGDSEMTISAFDKRHKKWRKLAENQVSMLKLAESKTGKIPGK